MKDSFKIRGSVELKGEITPQGAKNEALQVLSAVLLTDKDIEIENLPDILDIRNQIELLKGMGVSVEKISNNHYIFNASDVDIDYLLTPQFRDKASLIRGSVMFIGPLLARFGKAIVPKPGGDKIGRRRLDAHIQGFVALGASFDFNEADNLFLLKGNNLKGTYILLEEASVTGTANIIMAAVFAKGITEIYNAACEPYIQQLCLLLNNMGAKIRGAGTNLVSIEGVEILGGAKHRCLPDMIEVGSFIGLAAMTQSNITIKNVEPSKLGLIPNYFKKLGIDFYVKDNDIIVNKQDVYQVETNIDGSILTLADAPWPGFTPDLLSILLVIATQARGQVLIHQKMFESRLFFVDHLIDMGAQIILCDPHRATVMGLARKHKLRAITMRSPDIRAGVALLIAAMSANGTSTIHNINQIDRGYENIENRLINLGAIIERV